MPCVHPRAAQLCSTPSPLTPFSLSPLAWKPQSSLCQQRYKCAMPKSFSLRALLGAQKPVGRSRQRRRRNSHFTPHADRRAQDRRRIATPSQDSIITRGGLPRRPSLEPLQQSVGKPAYSLSRVCDARHAACPPSTRAKRVLSCRTLCLFVRETIERFPQQPLLNLRRQCAANGPLICTTDPRRASLSPNLKRRGSSALTAIFEASSHTTTPILHHALGTSSR